MSILVTCAQALVFILMVLISLFLILIILIQRGKGGGLVGAFENYDLDDRRLVRLLPFQSLYHQCEIRSVDARRSRRVRACGADRRRRDDRRICDDRRRCDRRRAGGFRAC